MGVFSFAELVLLSFFAYNAAFLGLFQPRQQVIHLFISNRLHIIGVCLTALMRYNNIRAPVPGCDGVVWDAATFCFPGQYGWIRACVEYA